MVEKILCDRCGAELYWSPEHGAMHCEYCGQTYTPEEVEAKKSANTEAEKPINEPEKADEDMVATDDSVSGDLVLYKCSECGAQIVTSKGTIATTCPFCDRTLIFENNIQGAKLPKKVVPFSISKEKAFEIFEKYCSSSPVVPNEFKSKKIIEKFKGVYVPYWLYNINNDVHATINCENQKSRRSGDDRITEIAQYVVTMAALAEFDLVPADALTHLDDELTKALEPFNYSGLKDFDVGYLSGFYTEEFNISAEECINQLPLRIEAATREELKKEAGTYDSKVISVYKPDIDVVGKAYAMMPVWIFHIKYEDKQYTYAINGQTGKVVGKLPMSKYKLVGKSGLYGSIAALIAGIIGVLI